MRNGELATAGSREVSSCKDPPNQNGCNRTRARFCPNLHKREAFDYWFADESSS